MTSEKRRYVNNKKQMNPNHRTDVGTDVTLCTPMIWHITSLPHHPTAASPNCRITYLNCTLACCARSLNSIMFIYLILFSSRISCTHSYSLQCHLRFFNHCLIFFPMIILDATFKYFLSSMRFHPFCFSFLWYIVAVLEFSSTDLVLWDIRASSCSNLDGSRRVDSSNPAWAPDRFLFLASSGRPLGFTLDGDFSSRIGLIWLNGS